MKALSIVCGNLVEQPVVPDASLHQIDENKYYGVTNGKQRGFIARNHYKEGSFRVRCTESVTRGNGFYYDGPSLEEVVTQIANNGTAKIFVFNSNKELFTWLAEAPEVTAK